MRNPAAPRHRLVWPDPTEGRLCRYYPLLGLRGKHVPHGTLYGQALFGAPDAQRLAETLNAIPSMKPGEIIHCPLGIGRHDVLFFGYSERAPVAVLATPDGCPSFTNGKFKTGTFSPAFSRYLRLVERLVPTRQQAVEKSLLHKEKLS